MKIRWKSLTFILVTIVLLFLCSFALAAEGTDGNITWSLSDDGLLTISGNGEMKDYDSHIIAPWGQGVKEVVIQDGVTSIGEYAFNYCGSMTSITIPDSVTSIRDYAFFYCVSITRITIPDNVTSIGDYAFYGCDDLESMNFPDSVTSIGSSAFDGCGKLTGIFTLDNVKSIGSSAFVNCPVIRHASYGSDGAKALSRADYSFRVPGEKYNLKFLFNGEDIIGIELSNVDKDVTDLIIPDNVTSIGVNAFYNCGSLSGTNIPDNVTSIGNSAFYGCSSLSDINISDNVTSIGNSAFYSCRSMTDITIPDNVTSIGSNAFANCSRLSSITIPDNVTSVGENAFSGCAAKRYANLGSDGAKALSRATYAFQIPGEKYYLKYVFSGGNITGLSLLSVDKDVGDLTVPDGVTSIGSSACYDCNNLTSIALPESVTSIGSNAFSGCSSLRSISILDGVTSIGNNAFKNCPAILYANLGSVGAKTISISGFSFRVPGEKYSLIYLFTNGNKITGLELTKADTDIVDLTISDRVTSIGKSAFYNCNKMISMTIPDSVTNIGTNAFYGCSAALYIRQGSNLEILISKAGYSFRNPGDQYSRKYMFSGEEIIGVELNKVDQDVVDLIIPDSVTSIGSYAFAYCNRLSSITIPDSVTSIGSYAFANCHSLSSIIIPGSVRSIADYAFSECYGLNKVAFLQDSETNVNISSCIFDLQYSSHDPVIYCYEYSSAESFALEEGYETILLDAVDLDTIRTVTLENDFRILCGSSRKLSINIFPDCPSVTWSSSDPTIITVADGQINALQPGTAVITASVGSASDSVVITVYPVAESFELNYTEEWIAAKAALQLLINEISPSGAETDIVWNSSDSTIATVDENGLVTTKKPGEVTITAMDRSTGIQNAVNLHVCYPVTAIDFEQDSQSIIPGQERQLIANVTMRTQSCVNHLVAFSSSNEDIAVVDEKTGVVKGIAPGTATITASGGEYSDTCTIIVREPNILIVPADVSVIENEAFKELPGIDAIKLPGNLAEIAEDAFDNDVIIIAPAMSKTVEWARTHGFEVIVE